MNYQSDKIYFYNRVCGIFKFTDSDRLRYLHNQSTNDFNRLQPGEGCQTVFVTSTARTLDLVTAYVTEDAVIVIVSSDRRQQLFKWLDGFIFPFDNVKLTDISEPFVLISLIGEPSHTLVQKLFNIDLQGQSEGSHRVITVNEIALRIAVGSDLGLPGYNLIIPQENAPKIRSLLKDNNVFQIDGEAWEQLRILQGRPAPDKELTEDYNPLEAGLLHTISFDKGCYIGQETIARLNTYNGVKQKLWGVKLDRPTTPQTPVMVEDKKVGVLTSYTETEEGSFGLAYVRTKAGGAGLTVTIGEATGKLVSVPFLDRS